MSGDFPEDPIKSKIIDFQAAKAKVMTGKDTPPQNKEVPLVELFRETNKLHEQEILGALEAYRKDPKNIDNIVNLGILASKTNRYKLAELLLKKALEINPNLAHVCSELGMMYGSMVGRESDAIKYLRIAVKLKPRADDCFLLAGFIRESDPMEAIGLYKKFLRTVDPNDRDMDRFKQEAEKDLKALIRARTKK
jgi:tetratricopeptide (TPR) repeat protein